MVTEIPLHEEAQRLRSLQLFRLGLVIITEVWAMLVLSNGTLEQTGDVDQLFPAITIISSTATSLAALACLTHYRRNWAHTAALFLWALISIPFAQRSLLKPADYSYGTALLYLCIAMVIGFTGEIRFLYRKNEKNREYHDAFAKEIIPKVFFGFLLTLGLLTIVLSAIYARL